MLIPCYSIGGLMRTVRDNAVDIIIPVYNESTNIKQLVKEINDIHLPSCTIIFVDDGSSDDTLCEIKNLMATLDTSSAIAAGSPTGPSIKYISFSRNFGHQAALKAGFDHSTGACAITMDGDLQHPPEFIPRMLALWEQGFDVIQMKRKTTQSTGIFKKFTSSLFYRIFNRISDTKIEAGTADFRLLDRKVINFCKNAANQDFFWRGLIPWAGFKTAFCEFDAPPRASGTSKYSLKKMRSLAEAGITGFSVFPLFIATMLGGLLLCFNLFYGIHILWKWFQGEVISGWTSLMFILLVSTSLQLIFLGILGLYISKIFIASKSRPSYIIVDKSL